MRIMPFLLLLAALTGCRAARQTGIPAGTALTVDGKLWASLFQQRAAEYQALCFQAYATARFRLDEALARQGSKPLAVVTDLDETVFDNSPYAVTRTLQGRDYEPESWAEWTQKGTADTLAGALGFFRYAASKGVAVFYVTNRDENEREGTLKNLRRFQFPDADDAHLLLRKEVSTKEPRRQQVLETHEIVLLIGDNLSDFDAAFDKREQDDRLHVTRRLSDQFGRKYIVLPNFTYGDWEGALYRYQYHLTENQKDSLIRKAVKGY